MAILETIPGKIIVLSVIVLITYLQTTVNFFIVGPALGGWATLLAQKKLAPLNIPLLSLYINYYLACTTRPSSPPKNWQPPSTVSTSDRVGFDKPRFCTVCQAHKPPRAHHCKQCGKCILKMDHHCPWIDNCVGFHNYPYFLRFIFSVIICCAYGIHLLFWRFGKIMEDKRKPWVSEKPSNIELAVIIINLVLATLVTMIVGILSVYHVYCVAKGQSTIEGSERVAVKKLVRNRKIEPVDFPFDVGFYANICSVGGHNIFSWILPLPSPGNGIDFAVKPDTDPVVVYYWPPYDPNNTTDSLIEHNDRDQHWSGRSLIRRDSEGYLVKEITMEDRMMMLNADMLMGNDEGYADNYDEEYADDNDWRFEDEEEDYIDNDFVNPEGEDDGNHHDEIYTYIQQNDTDLFPPSISLDAIHDH